MFIFWHDGCNVMVRSRVLGIAPEIYATCSNPIKAETVAHALAMYAGNSRAGGAATTIIRGAIEGE